MPHSSLFDRSTTHSTSRLARLQQGIAAGAVLLLGVWVGFSWERPWWVVAAGAALILFGYAWVLAIEFLAVAWVNRRDPAPQAGFFRLLRAWWREVCTAP